MRYLVYCHCTIVYACHVVTGHLLTWFLYVALLVRMHKDYFLSI